jgi:hypothetical protein
MRDAASGLLQYIHPSRSYIQPLGHLHCFSCFHRDIAVSCPTPHLLTLNFPLHKLIRKLDKLCINPWRRHAGPNTIDFDPNKPWHPPISLVATCRYTSVEAARTPTATTPTLRQEVVPWTTMSRASSRRLTTSSPKSRNDELASRKISAGTATTRPKVCVASCHLPRSHAGRAAPKTATSSRRRHQATCCPNVDEALLPTPASFLWGTRAVAIAVY